MTLGSPGAGPDSTIEPTYNPMPRMGVPPMEGIDNALSRS
jgi:hypothetical protein